VIFIEIPRFHGPANAMTKMSRARSIAAALAAALVVVGAFWFVHVRGPAGLDATDPALVALGKNVYADRCASCHGEHLEG
jgi:mono/diheme cytochrome c family protein